MRSTSFLLILLLSAAVFSCVEKDDPDDGIPDTVKEVVRMLEPEFVFGFIGEDRYSYCPSALLQDDGSIYMYFCGNPDSGIMVDNIYSVRIDPTGTVSEAKSVLQPGISGSWDDHHTCDPSVIEGEFTWNEETYRYAMFFLGNKNDVNYNEIGVAFSNDLNADSWEKYPECIVAKTWQTDGDQSLSNGGYSWGVGQPSAVSLDKKGNVLLTYTIGDLSGTRVVWREVDMSNVENMVMTSPRTLIQAGLYNIEGSSRDYTCNMDFAINPDEDKIVMIRPVQPHPSDYPSYIPIAQEINYMNLSDFINSDEQWETIYRITPTETGFPRNHNSCLLRDNFGHIDDWETPTFYYTVSKAEPDVYASGSNHAEWTYHIYKSSIYKQPL